MSEDYNMIPEENFEELRSRLKSLPKAKAPANFSHNLFADIERMEHEEKGNIIELPKQVEHTRSFWESFRPAYGIAAAILIGFVVYQLYPVAKRIQIQQSAPEVVENTPRQSLPKDAVIPPPVQSQLRPAPSQKPERTPAIASVTRRDEKNTNDMKNRAVLQDTRRTDVASVVNRNKAQIVQNASDRQQQQTPTYIIDAQAQLMQSAAQLPPDLFRQNHPPSGAQLTTISSGIIGSRSYDSLNAVDRTPWGAFNALQQGRDSLRLRDSLKARHHNAKVK